MIHYNIDNSIIIQPFFYLPFQLIKPDLGLRAGISRYKAMADEFMYIPYNDTHNYPFLKRLETQLNETTNLNSLKSPMLLSQQRRKRWCKTLGTSIINSQLSPTSLVYVSVLCQRTLFVSFSFLAIYHV